MKEIILNGKPHDLWTKEEMEEEPEYYESLVYLDTILYEPDNHHYDRFLDVEGACLVAVKQPNRADYSI